MHFKKISNPNMWRLYVKAHNITIIEIDKKIGIFAIVRKHNGIARKCLATSVSITYTFIFI